MTTSADALELDGATVEFDGRHAVERVTGTVARGGSLALVGPNGAGKTTLIRAILGLVPLVAGRIRVLGQDPADARADVAYVPQADVLDPNFPVTAADVVLMGRYRRIGWIRRPGADDKEAAATALERVGLTDRSRDRFGLLSGGQRQRVLLARAIAQEPALLLLDEPFNGVDSTTTDVVLELLTELRAQGVAIVMSTHDLAVAHLACEHCCLLNRRQVAFAPTREALTAELLNEAYGGTVLLSGGAAFVDTH